MRLRQQTLTFPRDHGIKYIHITFVIREVKLKTNIYLGIFLSSIVASFNESALLTANKLCKADTCTTIIRPSSIGIQIYVNEFNEGEGLLKFKMNNLFMENGDE